MADHKPVEVYVARDPTEARNVLSVLRAASIDGEIVGEAQNAGSYDLGTAAWSRPRIWVRACDAERANQRIAMHDLDHARGPADSGPDWTCAACGEQVEDTFAACWNCEAARPGEA